MSRARDFADLAGSADAGGITGRNLIINGDHTISQRNDDSSITSTADVYTTDRWAVGHGSPVNAVTAQRVSDAPDGFNHSIKVTAGTGASAGATGYAAIRQAVEGENIRHLSFGSSAAKSITLSFWVKSSLTGTFGVSVRNQAGNRAYGATYAISSANTFEYKTVTIPGDTSGTWPTDSGIGFNVQFDLGAGSNYDIASGAWTAGSNMFGVEGTVKLTETTGATWQLTGVQMEVGEQGTAFEHRSFGDELRRCQRYYFRTTGSSTGYGNLATVSRIGDTLYRGVVEFPVTMRSRPSFSSSGSFQTLDSGFTFSSMSGGDGASFDSHGVQVTMTSNGSAGQSSLFRQANDTTAALIYDAEL